ncbi:YjjG family noncanonical pyrimidine nucleotidase [Kurthia zopfii]|uniref:YjjG family noncanonical pyrimidine nucleotidase n=1 Tax=Kurthia zopfii TaxID=1650 RepID=UPI000F6CEB26|nr:YjjG family noncanonical pyrimidine nucleotidase [Kurthia zopfii]VEI07377.1 Putative HAD-hydrolase yfnB [Kurthia zopfii]
MKKYRALLFDLDDTIFDFTTGEEVALTEVCEKYISISDIEQIKNTYRKINKKLWHDFENNEISKDYLINNRFSLTFAQLGMEVDGLAVAQEYQQLLGKQCQLLPEAENTLKTLQDAGFDLYAVTNGYEITQKSRIALAQIGHYFKAIYISEQTGSKKPEIAFFDYVFEHSQEINKTEAMIIGDSISSDIQGGLNIGIDRVWYNRHLTDDQPDATYIVQNHKQLLQVFQKQVKEGAIL